MRRTWENELQGAITRAPAAKQDTCRQCRFMRGNFLRTVPERFKG